MMKQSLVSCIAVLTLPALCGCNDDVFVSRQDLPEYSEVKLEGDGGQWSAICSQKGLSEISISVPQDERRYLRYWDSDGKETDSDCPASELSAIVFENPLRHFSIGFLNDVIYINSDYNSGEDYQTELYLHYGSDLVKKLVVEINAGLPLEPVIATYRGEMELEYDYETIPCRTGYTNNSSLTQVFVIYPYEQARCYDEVATKQIWAIGQVVDMPMPAYTSDLGWIRLQGTPVTIGMPRAVELPSYPDAGLRVEVPPYTKATVMYTLHVTKATQSGTIDFYNKTVSSSATIDFTSTAIYSTSCTHTVIYEQI